MQAVESIKIAKDPESKQPFSGQRTEKIAQGFKLVSQLENFLRQNTAIEETEPLKFKDVVDRKFTFPFHLCSTWQVRS